MRKLLFVLYFVVAVFLNFSPSVYADADIGDVVTFGTYPYTEDGTKAPVEWIVVDIEAATGNAVLLSKYILDARRYDEKSNVWRTSELRTWLNSEFRDNMFSSEEKSQIDNQYVTLMSMKEVRKLLKGDKRIAVPTPYALKKGLYHREDIAGAHWWLRTPGYLSDTEAGILNDGSLCQAGERVKDSRYGIRPLIRVPADIFNVGVEETPVSEDIDFITSIKNKFFKKKNEEAAVSRNHISLGRYPMVNRKKLDPIDWIILEKNNDGTALITTNRLLSIQRYNTSTKHVNWHDSTIRKWLNDEFYSDAFATEERKVILTSKVNNRKKTVFGITGGLDTEDNIFMLSEDELKKYFPTAAEKKARPTRTVRQYRPESNDFGYSTWWLRTTSVLPHKAKVVDPYGEVSAMGRDTYSFKICVRPVMKVNLEAIAKLPASLTASSYSFVEEEEEKDVAIGDKSGEESVQVTTDTSSVPVSSGSVSVALSSSSAKAPAAADGAETENKKTATERFSFDVDPNETYSDDEILDESNQKRKTIYFGRYTVASSKRSDPLEWIVLENYTDGTSLLITRQLLSPQRYNIRRKNVNWDSSTLRSWLNDQFIEEAFAPEERELLKSQRIGNQRQTILGMRGGISTEDRIYLLSQEEVNKFFPTTEMKRAKASPNLKRSRSDVNSYGYASWWLRSSSLLPMRALYVTPDGLIESKQVYKSRTSIRPVIRVSIAEIEKLPPEIRNLREILDGSVVEDDGTSGEDKDKAMLPGEIQRIKAEKARLKEEALRKAEAERKAEEERKALEEFMKKSSGTVSGMQAAAAGEQDNSTVSMPPSVPEKGYEKKRYSSDGKKEDNSERSHFRHGFRGKEKGK